MATTFTALLAKRPTRRAGRPVRNDGISDARGRALFAALSKMFSWLLRNRKITANPFTSVWSPPTSPARDRVLDQTEVRWLWVATNTIGEPFGPLVRLLLLTGARLNEVARMTWSELSDDGATWSIPGSRTKNHLPHLLDLPPLAREILANVKHIAGKPGYVFTTNGRTPVSGFSKIKARLDSAMLAEARKERGNDTTIPPWRLHDLRRTAFDRDERTGASKAMHQGRRAPRCRSGPKPRLRSGHAPASPESTTDMTIAMRSAKLWNAGQRTFSPS